MVELRLSSYSFFVMLAFLGGLGERYNSISDLIRAADSISRDMGCEPRQTFMTKNNIIKRLEEDGLIVLRKNKGFVSARLKSKVEEFVIEMFEGVELYDDDKEDVESEKNE